MGPWECRLTSHSHALFFHSLDSGEKTMAMENLDTLMPTCRNPGRLDVTDTAEAGTDVPSRDLNGHVTEGYVVAQMPAEWSSQRVYPCRRSRRCRL